MSVENQNTIFEINIVFMGKLYLRDWKSHLRSLIPFRNQKKNSVTKSKSEFLCEVQLQFSKMKASLMKSRNIF